MRATTRVHIDAVSSHEERIRGVCRCALGELDVGAFVRSQPHTPWGKEPRMLHGETARSVARVGARAHSSPLTLSLHRAFSIGSGDPLRASLLKLALL